MRSLDCACGSELCAWCSPVPCLGEFSESIRDPRRGNFGTTSNASERVKNQCGDDSREAFTTTDFPGGHSRNPATSHVHREARIVLKNKVCGDFLHSVSEGFPDALKRVHTLHFGATPEETRTARAASDRAVSKRCGEHSESVGGGILPGQPGDAPMPRRRPEPALQLAIALMVGHRAACTAGDASTGRVAVRRLERALVDGQPTANLTNRAGSSGDRALHRRTWRPIVAAERRVP